MFLFYEISAALPRASICGIPVFSFYASSRLAATNNRTLLARQEATKPLGIKPSKLAGSDSSMQASYSLCRESGFGHSAPQVATARHRPLQACILKSMNILKKNNEISEKQNNAMKTVDSKHPSLRHYHKLIQYL